jgi:DNA-binding response OmpR family regulator
MTSGRVVCRNPDQVLMRERVLAHVCGFDFDPGSNVVDMSVRYLWRKLGADRFEAVRGTGCRLRPWRGGWWPEVAP